MIYRKALAQLQNAIIILLCKAVFSCFQPIRGYCCAWNASQSGNSSWWHSVGLVTELHVGSSSLLGNGVLDNGPHTWRESKQPDANNKGQAHKQDVSLSW